MNRFKAWLLLIVSTTQWIGGHVCYEVAHWVEVEQVMSEPEREVSDKIYETTGIEASVNILPEGQRTRMGADYANYFAFSKSDSTGTIYYTIDYAPRTVTWEQVATHLPDERQDDAPKSALLKMLFSEFSFENNAFLEFETSELAIPNFHLSIPAGRMAASPNAPPPDFS